MTTRRARPSDAATMARTIKLGAETYMAFAPAEWRPWPPAGEVEALTRQLGRRDTWALMAEIAGEPAAHVSLMPDWQRETRVYLWQLFVRPAWWGTGLAAGLHDAFVAEARARGYRDARLNTPAAHGRARRFYERRGWTVAGPPATWRGLPVAEYECRLPA